MKKVLPILLAFLCACETEPALEAPRILSITPAAQFASDSQSVIVELDQEPRFFVDYGRKTVERLGEPVLEVGPQTVRLDTYLGHGQLQGIVAPGLEVGRYDIRVALGDGREASLSGAYEVKDDSERPVLGYWIESIGTQFQNQPFTITLHAAGASEASFGGSVMVSLYKGNAKNFSFRSGSFSGGVRQEQLVIDTFGDNFLVVIEDDLGNTATSNAFRVDKN